LKKLLITLLKFGVSIALLVYLVRGAAQDNAFEKLRDQPKDWYAFGGAFLLCFLAVVLSIVRWYFLVRALELPFRLRDALRLGFLGYLLNFFSLGNVGGDLFKAVFIAREQHGRRAEAVATVVVDRVIGLYVLFLVATTAIFWTGFLSSGVREIQIVCRATLTCTVVGGVGLVVLLWPGFTNGVASRRLSELPRVGPIIERLLLAVRMYRRKPAVLLLAAGLTVGVHVFTALGVYLVARGLPGTAPSLGSHFVVVPLAMVVGALPLPLSGLGAFEGALDFLYVYASSPEEVSAGQGLLVAFGYRLVTVAIAMVGVGIWLASRREVAATLHDAEEIEAGHDPDVVPPKETLELARREPS